MKKIISLSLVGFSVLITQYLYAEEHAEEMPSFKKEDFVNSAQNKKPLQISLYDCITYALKNNSEIKVNKIEPQLKEEDIRSAKAVFEPYLGVNFNLTDTTKRSPNSTLFSPPVSKTRAENFDIGIGGKTTTGANYQLDFLSSKYKSNSSSQIINPYTSVEPNVSLTQPLLRNFGTFVNRAGIIIAKKNKKISEESLKTTVMDIIVQTKNAYNNYYFFIESYQIAQRSLSRAEELFKINKARYDKGLISSIDLLETETIVAQRNKVLISAESNLKKAEDDLKLITNLVDDPEVWNAPIELVDKPILSFRKVDLIESLTNAFVYRPDYQMKMSELSIKDISIKVAKNTLYPVLDIMGSFGLNGLGGNLQDALEIMDPDYKNWYVGANVRIPWGGAERAQYNQTKLDKAKTLIELKRLEQKIILEVRDKVRAVDIQFRQVKASEISKEKETKNYQAQMKRYAAGEISTHDMLDYQDSLAQSELDYVKGLIDYNTALIQLDFVQGLTLVRDNIVFER